MIRDAAHSETFRRKKALHWAVLCVAVMLCLLAQLSHVAPAVAAAGATTTLRVMKLDSEGAVLGGRTVDYQWMEKNLPVQGDGVTHYYHQGPVFEGDMWDPGETVNLKDKGAVRGTDVRDLCELAGGMSTGDEVMLVAVDNWSTRLAYSNVYEPDDRQGPVVLCWYKGQEEGGAVYHGSGYPAEDAYNEAIQVVFMARTANASGQYVFGNADMQVCLPEEEYQHYYDGLPSTNGLSGKWIDRVVICPGGSTPVIPDMDTQAKQADSSGRVPWLPIALGGAGLLMVGAAAWLFIRRKSLPRSGAGGA